MAQYQSYCHINFVLNIKGAGLINKFTAFIAIFTFYGAGQNGSLRWHICFTSATKLVNSTITGAKKPFNTRYLLWFAQQKGASNAATKNKSYIFSPFYKPTIKLAFISTDLSAPHWSILFNPKVYYQTHQKMAQNAHQTKSTRAFKRY